MTVKEYRFTAIFSLGGILSNSGETEKSALNRAIGSEKPAIEKWIRTAQPGSYRFCNIGSVCLICNATRGTGSTVHADDEEEYGDFDSPEIKYCSCGATSPMKIVFDPDTSRNGESQYECNDCGNTERL